MRRARLQTSYAPSNHPPPGGRLCPPPAKTPEAPKGAPEAPKGGVAPKKDMPKGEDSLSAKPREIDLPAVVVPAPVIQVGGTEPALEIDAPKPLPKTLDPQDPPLNVKPFIPPM